MLYSGIRKGILLSVLACTFMTFRPASAVAEVIASVGVWKIKIDPTQKDRACQIDNGAFLVTGSPDPGFYAQTFLNLGSGVAVPTATGSTYRVPYVEEPGGTLTVTNPALGHIKNKDTIVVNQAFVRRMSGPGPVVIDDPIFRREYTFDGSTDVGTGKELERYLREHRFVTLLEKRDGNVLISKLKVADLDKAENLCEHSLAAAKTSQ